MSENRNLKSRVTRVRDWVCVSRARKMGVAALTLAASGVVWASCGGTEGLVANQAGMDAKDVMKTLVTTTKNIMTNDKKETDSIVSAIKANTTQVLSSIRGVMKRVQEAEEASAVVDSKISDQKLADKVYYDYNSQGYDPCGTKAKVESFAKAEKQALASVGDRVLKDVEAVGKYGSVAASLKARAALHQELFCTQEEVAAGLCSAAGKLPGGDSNAALLFSTDKSDEAVAAKNAVINQMIGPPDEPIPSSVAKGAVADGYAMSKRKKDVYLSFAAYSLKSIQVENEEVRPLLETAVGDYYGTPRATEWAKTMAWNSERGVLVDLVKIQGLQLKMQERRLRALARIAAISALQTNLDVEQNQRPDVAMARAQLVASDARRKVQ